MVPRLYVALTSRSSWQRLIILWFTGVQPVLAKVESAASLRSAYVMLNSSVDRAERPPNGQGMLKPTRRDTNVPVDLKEDEYIKLALAHAAASLLVAAHACLSKDDWIALLPYLWSMAEPDDYAPRNTKAVRESPC